MKQPLAQLGACLRWCHGVFTLWSLGSGVAWVRWKDARRPATRFSGSLCIRASCGVRGGPLRYGNEHDATAVSGSVNFHVGWSRWRDVVARAYRGGSAAAAVLEALSVCARASINSAHACACVHCHVGRGVSEIGARCSRPTHTNKRCRHTCIFSARLIFLEDLSGYLISPRHDIDMRRRWDTDL